jgi:hypothetical protein
MITEMVELDPLDPLKCLIPDPQNSIPIPDSLIPDPLNPISNSSRKY